MIWKKFRENHVGQFSDKLKLNTDFPIHTGYCICMFHLLYYTFIWISDVYFSFIMFEADIGL